MSPSPTPSTSNTSINGIRVNASNTGYVFPGGGKDTLPKLSRFRATTNNLCGFWPFVIGASSPMVGVPLGRNARTGQTVCADPISWFQRGNLISNPSAFVMGRPGLGKSTLIRRWVTGLSAFGVIPMILGDVKPDYVDLIQALGGQVIKIGPGQGFLNVLDPGAATTVAAQLPPLARAKVLADAKSKVIATLLSLITVLRRSEPTEREETILTTAIDLLFKEDRTVAPVLSDLLAVLRSAHPDLRSVALDRGDLDRYKAATENLEASLQSLIGGGKLGGVFAGQTTTPIELGRPIVFDISHIDNEHADLKAAVLLTCWSAGFTAINLHQALADAGIVPQRNFFVVLDELWSALQAGPGLVQRVDQLTRLNRTFGVGQAMCTHTMKDLNAISRPEDQAKALGFVERSGMVVCAGLPRNDMPRLRSVLDLSGEEEALLTSWDTPPSWDAGNAHPPGLGKFLIKVGARPGIAVDVKLTSVEKDVNNTNQRWAGK